MVGIAPGRECLAKLMLTAACLFAGNAFATDEPVVESIQLYPAQLTLDGRDERSQLIVVGKTSDGHAIDLTDRVDYEFDHDIVTVGESGVIVPVGDGDFRISAKWGELTAIGKGVASTNSNPVSFRQQVLPTLARSGCSGGACHGSPNGKAGFRLSLFGSDHELDRRSLSEEFFGRRVNFQEPGKSLLLRKPTTELTHQGGKRLDVQGLRYQHLRQWISQGCRVDAGQSPCVGIEVYPSPTALVRHFPNADQQFAVIARYADGSERDVTHLATFTTSDPKVAEIQGDGQVTAIGRGEAAIIVRYLDQIETPLMTFVREIDGFVWQDPKPANYVDEHVFAKLRELQYSPSPLCTDEQFIRRVSLDVLGILPDPEEVRAFVADRDENKRESLIDRLLARPEYSKFWAQKWGDLLRVSTKLIGKAGVHKFSRWLENSVATNQPYDQFASLILLAEGSTREQPAGNFFRSAADTSDSMETVAQVFLGTRIQCAKCHNHPFERWTQDNYYGLSTFFHRVQRSKIPGDDGLLLWTSDAGEVVHPVSGKRVEPWVPGDAEIRFEDGRDRRDTFAQWIGGEGKRMLARIEVNRIWAQVMGRGIVEPFDDFRDSNPPANAPLLEALTDDFLQQGFDRKQILRTILLSRTYQASAQTDANNRDDSKYFSHYVPRMLTAEQLIDALGHVTGRRQKFHGVPESTLATWLPAPDLKPHDRSKIGDIELLKVFGQPARQSACECERGDDASLGQALQLINGKFVHQIITDKNNDVRRMLAEGKEPPAVLSELYMRALSRPPTAAESQIHAEYLASQEDIEKAMEDLCWTLLNHNEFLFQH